MCEYHILDHHHHIEPAEYSIAVPVRFRKYTESWPQCMPHHVSLQESTSYLTFISLYSPLPQLRRRRLHGHSVGSLCWGCLLRIIRGLVTHSICLKYFLAVMSCESQKVGRHDRDQVLRCRTMRSGTRNPPGWSSQASRSLYYCKTLELNRVFFIKALNLNLGYKSGTTHHIGLQRTPIRKLSKKV